MGVRVEWVRYGRDAADALRAEIAGIKGSDALAPVTVVVPSNHVGVAARRLLASGALGPVCENGVGLAAVSFVTPYRLAELLGAPTLAGAGRRPVSTPVIAAAFRGALAREPGLFEPVAAHPSTEAALVAAYRELREVSPAGLDAIAATGARARDVVRLHRAARAELEGTWYDEQDLMDAAAGQPLPTDIGAVVVYLPQRISPHVGRMLRAVGEGTPMTVLAGVTGEPRADADINAGIRRIAADADTPPVFEPYEVTRADRTRIVLASDADDEVRVAVRAVIDAVRTGTPLDRVAVLHASPEPYARLAHEHLRAAGIATNGPAVMPLAGRVAGRVLLDLFALPEQRFRRQDVFAWLASAPLLRDGRWVPTTAWERLSREAGVVAGRDHWDELLATLAEERAEHAEAVAEDPDGFEWQAEALRKDAERALELRAFVVGLVDDLTAAAAGPRRWGEHARWAHGHLQTLLGGPNRRGAWPKDERTAAERVEMALDRLGALDSVEDAVDLDVFARTLALELETDLGRVGRFGEGVLVGPITMGIGLDLDLVVVLGLAEGTFPAPVRDDSLLPDDERAAAGDELTLRRSRVDREHRDLLAALAGSSHHLLGVPRGDLRRSREPVPSRWVLDIASRLAGEQWWAEDLLRGREPWIQHVASFAADVRELAFPATPQEHRLRTLMVARPRGAADLVAATEDDTLAAAAGVVEARRSGRFTRFDGNLAGLPVRSPIDTATTATRLERWADCPFAYFVRDVLGIDEIENPEDALQITPIDRGNLVHAALERFVREVLARPADEQPRPDEPWPPADRARLLEIGAELCDHYEDHGQTGRPIFWRRDRRQILADLEHFLDADDFERAEHRTRPLAAELAFGLRGADLDAVPVALPDGRALRFRGQADRIDVDESGGLHVVDYKTGRSDDYAKISADDPDERGTHLQLAVYGAAARHFHGDPDAEVRADYWFVTSRGKFRRYGYEITDDVRDRVGETIGTIVTGIEAGVFASHPTDEASTRPWAVCPACDPDGLGIVELRRAWDAKRTDPALVAYAELSDPFEDVEPEIEERDLSA